jgi:hypothetical protein
MILKYLWQKIDEKLAKILAFFIYNTLSLWKNGPSHLIKKNSDFFSPKVGENRRKWWSLHWPYI